MQLVVSTVAKHDWREQIIVTRERVKGFFSLTKGNMAKLIKELTEEANS